MDIQADSVSFTITDTVAMNILGVLLPGHLPKTVTQVFTWERKGLVFLSKSRGDVEWRWGPRAQAGHCV